MTSRDQVRIVKEKVLQMIRDSAQLSAARASVGIAISADGQQSIKIAVDKPLESHLGLPSDIDGIPVRVEVVGETTDFR